MLGNQSDLIQANKAAHEKSDVDAERSSQHHTLGKSPFQAAPGNHLHIGSVAIFVGAIIPVGWLPLAGQTINQSSYPEFFAFAGATTSTMTLPTWDSAMVRVK